jgi:aspartate kinase
MQVFKFGGASVKNALAIKNVAKIITQFAQGPTVIVVSAMAKTTNLLEEIVNVWFANKNFSELFNQLKTFHLAVIAELNFEEHSKIYEDVENIFTEILWHLEEEITADYNYHYDQVVSQGESLSSKIIAAYLLKENLPAQWLDVRGILQTDNTYREGKIDYELSETLVSTQLLPLLQTKIIVTQGFIGGTSENYTTTLGREGSDYTAALLAYFTNAQNVTIWKDVPGVLNADPKFFKNTKKIDELSYHDAIELTYYGASVIHPKTIKPLQNKNIPLYVKSFLEPAKQGTVIKESDKKIDVISYIFKDNQILISVQPKDFSFIAEDNLSIIFSLLSKHRVHANLIQNSAISFSICADNEITKNEGLIRDLEDLYKVSYNVPVELMTIRNYNAEIIKQLSSNKTVLMVQSTRSAYQMVMKQDSV